MRKPPFKCLFCSSTTNPFTRIEHPIPESLGNDEIILDKGFLCDICNQYFGSKVENIVINSPPFGVERVSSNVKTKKGKSPYFESLPFVELYPTGFHDLVVVAASPEYWTMLSQAPYLLLPHNSRFDLLHARWLLKMGLELLLMDDTVDPYNNQFNDARQYARAPKNNQQWQLGYGIYPDRKELIIARKEDIDDPTVTEILYQYSLGIMPSGDVGFSFMYKQHCYAINLSRPYITEYVQEFNKHNVFTLKIIDTVNL